MREPLRVKGYLRFGTLGFTASHVGLFPWLESLVVDQKEKKEEPVQGLWVYKNRTNMVKGIEVIFAL